MAWTALKPSQAPRLTKGDFGEYWPFHLRHEHQRIHQARYSQHISVIIAAANSTS